MPRTIQTTVTFSDGTSATGEFRRPPLGDQVAFERHFGRSISLLNRHFDQMTGDPLPDNPPPTEWMAFLVWASLRRQGKAVGQTFEEFVDLAEDIAMEGVVSDDESSGGFAEGADGEIVEVAADPLDLAARPGS
jgi:hypothetical protein